MTHARVRVAGGPLNRVHIPSVAIATASFAHSLALACVVKTTMRRLLLAMPLIDSRPLRGWRFLLLNIVLGLGNVVVLSNVPGYTILAPYAASNLQGVTPSFGTWATTDHMMGIALGFGLARWLAARFGDYRVLVARLCFLRGDVALLRDERHDLFFGGLAGSARRGRRRHYPGRTIRAARRISGEPENVRRRALGRAQHDAVHGLGTYLGGWYSEFLGWRFLFYSNIPVALLSRRRRGFAALWPRVAAALPAFRLRWFFAAGGDSLWVCRRFSTWATTSTGSTRRSWSSR